MNQMKITSRQLAFIVLLDLIFVSIWGISMVLDMITADSVETIDQAFNYVINPSIFYYMSYINAVLFTCVGTVMFVGLYLYYQSKEYSILNVIGLIFIPIYALLNIFAYGSQITIIPVLILNFESKKFLFVQSGLDLENRSDLLNFFEPRCSHNSSM